MSGDVAVRVVSYGFLHGPAPQADLSADVRRSLLDPHQDPHLTQLTGRDEAVRRKVIGTRGALWLAADLATAAEDLHSQTGGTPVTVAVGCAGGRHRSVVLADHIGEQLRLRQLRVVVEHRDIDKPVVSRSTVAEYLSVPMPKASDTTADGAPAWPVHDAGHVTAYRDKDDDPVVRLPDGTVVHADTAIGYGAAVIAAGRSALALPVGGGRS